jgi:hypothetical protein
MPAITTQGTSRKQLFIVIGLGVALLAIVALQAPKFLGGGSEAAAPTSTTGALPTSSTAGGTPATVSFSQGKGAVLAGVKLVQGVAPKPAPGQLASFSLFVKRDPFVQLVKDADATAASQDGEPAGVKVSNGGGGGAGGVTASGGTPSSSVPQSSQLTNATIWVNGSDNAVEVKGRFPKSDPTFVLAGLKPKVAQIGVVGGSFTGGGTIPLKMGQTLTLVNTATGARYTLRLVYTGAQPEQVQQFSQNGK